MLEHSAGLPAGGDFYYEVNRFPPMKKPVYFVFCSLTRLIHWKSNKIPPFMTQPQTDSCTLTLLQNTQSC